PFNTNLLAQVAALAALDDEEHLKQTLATNQEGLTYFYRELEELGHTCIPTQANFFLVRVGKEASSVYEALLKEGVIVRVMAAYGLDEYLRISVGLPEENERCIQSLKKVLAGK
ncbi:MAG: aminotransferase class I/II-fold pyridoxal phosphate-dependent enzyme, partial [Thermodesulfobacteriota bacterium]|nr:aminotransferase class I/II-fold pyridoxal phosphate-dependent enzyme [Thermodesulfobacteriota bacterium]